MPVLQGFLTTEITILTITVGTSITIFLVTLGVIIIWWLFTCKQKVEANKRQKANDAQLAEQKQEIAQLKEQLSNKEKLEKQYLRNERSNLDRLNELTRESNELRRKLREQTVFKAIYYDPDYITSWIENPEAVAEFFAERGFEILNASQLGHWVDERMKYKEACRSLLVFAQDVVPDTVADLRSATCKLRLFLNEGARVVWHGDVPFWRQALPGKRYEEWMNAGPQLVLGVDTFFSDRPVNCILTEVAYLCGMKLPGPATTRPVLAQTVNDIFTVSPVDIKTNIAGVWRKSYNSNFPHSGFLRYWPGSRDGRNPIENADYLRFAISGWSAVPEIELPEVEVPHTQTFVSDNQADMFRRANTEDPWELAAVEPHYWAWMQIPGAQWIWWRHWVTPEFQTGGKVEHKREFVLDEKPRKATLLIAVDDQIRNLKINEVLLGTEVGNWYQVTMVDLTPHLKQGKNLLEMIVVNVDGPAPTSPDDNPTGVCYRIDVIY